MSIGAKGYVKLTLNIMKRQETKRDAGLEEGRYELYCVCAKHSSYITHLDFSEGKEALSREAVKWKTEEKPLTPTQGHREEIGRVYGGMHFTMVI